ncbi:UNVERIFIED_CONTAM: hypothetical protein RMT77_010198 [Armadillidium vulgare]
MNNNHLYRNVFSRGLQESPIYLECEGSPMTSLANTLLGASLSNTPCKRLSLSSTLSDTPQSLKDESFISASKEKTLSPPLLKSSSPNKENLATYYLPSNSVKKVHLIQSPLKEVQNTVTRTLNFSPLKKTISPARRVHLSPLKNPTPPDEYDSNSRDSGYSESGKKRDGFNVPRSCAPSRRLNLDMSPKMSPFKSPPEGRKARSFASLKKKSEDDEFLMELICGAQDISTDTEEDDDEQTTSASFSSLLSAPIQSHQGSFSVAPPPLFPAPNLSCASRLPIRRCLSMIDTSTPLSSRVKCKIENVISESFEELTGKKSAPVSFKRPKSPQGDSFIIESKRRKENPDTSVEELTKEKDENCNKEENSKVVLTQRHLSNPEAESKDFERPKILRSQSEGQLSIMKAVSLSSDSTEELTGDFMQPLCLPTVQGGKHPDLKSISIHTMAALLKGEYDGKIASFKVLDCRYPYEYKGGHIRDAVNWYNLKLVQDYLDAQEEPPKISTAESPRRIHIFHCEFSAERGPKAQRFLREVDRNINKENYPALHFPEIYLLEGGYKAFYEAYPELCSPKDYVRMLDEKHSEDLKFFRSKSRSWVTENKQSRCPVTRAGPKRLGL